MLLHGNLGKKEGRKRAGKREFGANSPRRTAARILAARGIITVVREVHILRKFSEIWKNKSISIFDTVLFVGVSVSSSASPFPFGSFAVSRRISMRETREIPNQPRIALCLKRVERKVSSRVTLNPIKGERGEERRAGEQREAFASNAP